MKYLCLVFITILTLKQTNAQAISGNLKHHAGQEFTFQGFDYYETKDLATTIADSLGNFTLHYPKEYKGMALLKSQDKNSLVLLLGKEPFVTIQGTHITETDSLQFNATENATFFKYAIGQGYRTNALNAWKYLDKLYNMDKQFTEQKKVKKIIQKELQRIKETAQKLVNGLATDSYLRWFIPYRKFIQEMPTIIRTETERIPASIALFRNTDFNHANWKTSGVLKEFIEAHYFMLENYKSLEENAVEMNLSSKALIYNLKDNKELLNKVSKELFIYLEERSLYKASKYLAVELLTNHRKTLELNVIKRLEKYGSLKIGNKAPNIQFADKKLSDYKQPVLLVFGVSDCAACKTEAVEMLKYYDAWKSKNVEVVYISLDTDKTVYEQAYKNAPWQMVNDFKGWKSEIVKSYAIYGTPTYFLLDAEGKIVSHINSVGHANAFIMSRL